MLLKVLLIAVCVLSLGIVVVIIDLLCLSKRIRAAIVAAFDDWAAEEARVRQEIKRKREQGR